MTKYNRSDLTKKLNPIRDSFLESIKKQFFENKQKEISISEYTNIATNWFLSSTENNIHGWKKFSCIDVTTGNTSYIESFLLRYGHDGFQILEPYEYGYYMLIGKRGNLLENLENDKPLIISIPNWHYGGVRPNWEYILKLCEQKNIDIHLDLAWLTVSRNIDLDLDHPCIKSFAMSTTKYTQEWARTGIRWSKQRTIDSITILNHYYSQNNSSLYTAGAYAMQNIPRDYAWNTYKNQHQSIAKEFNMLETNLVNIIKDRETDEVYGIANLIENNV